MAEFRSINPAESERGFVFIRKTRRKWVSGGP
jgi:hypothetical protein